MPAPRKEHPKPFDRSGRSSSWHSIFYFFESEGWIFSETQHTVESKYLRLYPLLQDSILPVRIVRETLHLCNNNLPLTAPRPYLPCLSRIPVLPAAPRVPRANLGNPSSIYIETPPRNVSSRKVCCFGTAKSLKLATVVASSQLEPNVEAEISIVGGSIAIVELVPEEQRRLAFPAGEQSFRVQGYERRKLGRDIQSVKHTMKTGC